MRGITTLSVPHPLYELNVMKLHKQNYYFYVCVCSSKNIVKMGAGDSVYRFQWILDIKLLTRGLYKILNWK